MKKHSRMLCMALSLIMAMSLVPTVALAASVENCSGSCDHVAAIGTTHYDTLEEAFKTVSDSTVTEIKLLKSASGCGIIVPEGKNITLDFGGHTYTVNQTPLAGSSGTKSQCFQLLKDSNLTFKNGTIAADHGEVQMIIQNYSNLTLDKMVIDGRDKSHNITYTLSNNCGNVKIKDTTIYASEKPGSVAFDVYGGFQTYGDVSVTVSGNSVINGKVEVDRGSGTQNKNTLSIEGGQINGELSVRSNEKTTVSISGGTFTNKPNEAYLVNGFEIVQYGNEYKAVPLGSIQAPAEIPETGDDNNILLYGALMLLALAGMMGTTVIGKRKRV